MPSFNELSPTSGGIWVSESGLFPICSDFKLDMNESDSGRMRIWLLLSCKSDSCDNAQSASGKRDMQLFCRYSRFRFRSWPTSSAISDIRLLFSCSTSSARSTPIDGGIAASWLNERSSSTSAPADAWKMSPGMVTMPRFGNAIFRQLPAAADDGPGPAPVPPLPEPTLLLMTGEDNANP